MSYNTRRTGSAGRGQTTQVNYHQQPSRPGATATQQAARNPGYTTTPSPNYNSASQPVYSTQQPAGYTTTTPPQQTPATQPTQPPLPAQPTPSTPVAGLKQEPVTPAETPTNTETPASENGDGPQTKPFWKKKPFIKLSNKVKRARQNAKLRRVLNPKNALTFLNELRPGSVKFSVREETGWGFVASVDIDGKNFSGHGLTVSKAKVQASEQALRHILLEQMTKSAASASTDKAKVKQEDDEDEEMVTEEKEGEDEEPKAKKQKTEQAEDELPWGSLAAFALHKLFEHWQKEGEVVPGPSQVKYDEEIADDESFYRRPGIPDFGYPRRPPPGAPMFGRGRGFGPFPSRRFMEPRSLPPTPASAFLSNTQRQPIPLGNAPLATTIFPMKKLPEDANKRNPVMLLNQLRPNVVYNEVREGDAATGLAFKITINLDGQEYVGRGKSKKDAKKRAAKYALAPLGVVYEDDNNQ